MYDVRCTMYYVRFWEVSAPVGRGFVTTPPARGGRSCVGRQLGFRISDLEFTRLRRIDELDTATPRLPPPPFGALA